MIRLPLASLFARRRSPVTRIRDARNGSRMIVTGTICRARSLPMGPSYVCICELDDGTGQLELCFVDRRRVPGLGVGVRCSVEGQARGGQHGLQLWNPTYQIDR